MKVYVAGPYGANSPPETQETNCRRADRVGRFLCELGFTPLVPHNLTRGWQTEPAVPYMQYYRVDMEWLHACDALVRLEGEADGADWEEACAVAIGKPTYRRLRYLVLGANAPDYAEMSRLAGATDDEVVWGQAVAKDDCARLVELVEKYGVKEDW